MFIHVDLKTDALETLNSGGGDENKCSNVLSIKGPRKKCEIKGPTGRPKSTQR